MDNIINRITLYHNLYLACLIAALIFLIVSIILFIRLDVVGIIGFLTGSQAKKEIERLEKGGVVKKGKQSMGKKQEGHAKAHSVKFRKVTDIPTITITKKLEDGTEEKTELLRVPEETGEKTTLLQQEPLEFYTEREILLVHTNEIIE